MSNGTATMNVPTNESSTMTILAIDLGKFKSVACRFDPTSGAHAFETIATTPVSRLMPNRWLDSTRSTEPIGLDNGLLMDGRPGERSVPKVGSGLASKSSRPSRKSQQNFPPTYARRSGSATTWCATMWCSCLRRRRTDPGRLHERVVAAQAVRSIGVARKPLGSKNS